MPRFLALKLIFLFVLSGQTLHGQHKFWISNELTQSPEFLQKIPKPSVCSEWLEACSYELTECQLQYLLEANVLFSPVLSFSPQRIKTNKLLLGFALEQIGGQKFINEGLDGKGVKIGIIDGGFLKANTDISLSYFFENGLVASYKDYVTPDMAPYDGAIGLDDNHGTEVWRLIGGVNTEKKVQYGLATASSYYLARTDHGGYEKHIEEDYIIKALEDMEKEGVRLVNISLGYNTGFKSPESDYKPSQMDGKTTKIAQAIDYAALEKGMLIVVAAGNDGKDKWQIIDTPADAKYALTVGASKFEVWDKMNYSSIGPDFTDFVKPDISVYSTIGTSYSTPIVTGMAACIWQKNPELTNLEIMEIFKKAGNFYPYPNNYLGYGVPTVERILKVMGGDSSVNVKEVRVSRSDYKIKLKEKTQYVVAYHKKDERNVTSRVMYRPKKEEVVKIKRMKDAVQTSVLVDREVVEIFWE